MPKNIQCPLGHGFLKTLYRRDKQFLSVNAKFCETCENYYFIRGENVFTLVSKKMPYPVNCDCYNKTSSDD